MELGDAADAGHLAVGRAAAAVSDLLVTVGPGAAGIARGAVEAGFDAGRVHEAEDREAALDVLRPRLRSGDVLLVKASRGVALDHLVDRLREELGPPSRGAAR